MQIVSPSQIPPAVDIREIIREIGLTPSEQKTLSAAREKIGKVADLAGKHTGPSSAANSGKESPLLHALWKAQEKFRGDPSDQTASALRDAAMAYELGDALDRAFSQTSAIARTDISKTLRPMVSAVIDRAEKKMLADLEIAKQALASVPGLEKELELFELKIEAARALVTSQRALAGECPLSWLGAEVGF